MKQSVVARKVGKKPISHENVWQLFGPQVGTCISKAKKKKKYKQKYIKEEEKK